MEKSFLQKECPQCGFYKLKTWQELADDERILAEKMPLSAQFNRDERKRHLFCVRCWFETKEPEISI